MACTLAPTRLGPQATCSRTPRATAGPPQGATRGPSTPKPASRSVPASTLNAIVQARVTLSLWCEHLRAGLWAKQGQEERGPNCAPEHDSLKIDKISRFSRFSRSQDSCSQAAVLDQVADGAAAASGSARLPQLARHGRLRRPAFAPSLLQIPVIGSIARSDQRLNCSHCAALWNYGICERLLAPPAAVMPSVLVLPLSQCSFPDAHPPPTQW